MLTTPDDPAVIDAKARWWSEIAIFAPSPPAFVALLWGLRRNIAMMFGVKNLEWCVYLTVKKFADMITHFDTIHKRDGRTDGHRRTGQHIGRAYA